MPVFQFDNQLVYFSHIPKTAGTSLETFLREIGATQHMFSYNTHNAPRASRIINLPPQHLTAEQFDTLFDRAGFSGVFLFTRHPEDRLISAYRHRVALGGIHAKLSFTDWVAFVFSAYEIYPYLLEGHIIPQSAYMVPGAEQFKLEDSFDKFRVWIGNLLGIDESTLPEIARLNTTSAPTVTVNKAARRMINEFYKDDFEKLGYQPRNPDDAPGAGIMFGFTRWTSWGLGKVYGMTRR